VSICRAFLVSEALVVLRWYYKLLKTESPTRTSSRTRVLYLRIGRLLRTESRSGVATRSGSLAGRQYRGTHGCSRRPCGSTPVGQARRPLSRALTWLSATAYKCAQP
jgi:hypothetical protein